MNTKKPIQRAHEGQAMLMRANGDRWTLGCESASLETAIHGPLLTQPHLMRRCWADTWSEVGNSDWMREILFDNTPDMGKLNAFGYQCEKLAHVSNSARNSISEPARDNPAKAALGFNMKAFFTPGGISFSPHLNLLTEAGLKDAAGRQYPSKPGSLWLGAWVRTTRARVRWGCCPVIVWSSGADRDFRATRLAKGPGHTGQEATHGERRMCYASVGRTPGQVLRQGEE